MILKLTLNCRDNKIISAIFYGMNFAYFNLQKNILNVLFAEKHPYTQGLFDALPKIIDDREMLQPIPGQMLDPMELPDGCAFAPRCKYAAEKCNQGIPSKTYFGDTHYVACWRYEDPEFKL